MKRKFKIACFGGTFDIIHKGHEALIKKAFEVADFCYIGLTSDEYMMRKGKRNVNPFDKRKKNLVRFLSSKKIGKNRYKITKLDNFFGPEVLDPNTGIEAIIVSEKTIFGARGINILREDYGLKPLTIIEIPLVHGKDGEPLSSTKLKAKIKNQQNKI